MEASPHAASTTLLNERKATRQSSSVEGASQPKPTRATDGSFEITEFGENIIQAAIVILNGWRIQILTNRCAPRTICFALCFFAHKKRAGEVKHQLTAPF